MKSLEQQNNDKKIVETKLKYEKLKEQRKSSLLVKLNKINQRVNNCSKNRLKKQKI